MKQPLPSIHLRTNSKFMCDKLMKYFSALWVFMLAATIVLAQGGPGSEDFKAGEKFRKNRQNKEAVEAYDRAINAEPNNDKYWFRKGQSLAAQKEPASVDAAIKAFDKVTQLNPNLAAAYNMLYKLYVKQKNYTEALKNIRLAFDKESDQERKVKYKVVECKTLLQLDKTGDALTALSAAKAIRPSDRKVIGIEGDIYLRENKPDQALESFSKAFKIASDAKDQRDMGLFKMKMAIAYLTAGKKSEFEREKGELCKETKWASFCNQLKKREKGENVVSKELKMARAYISVNDFDLASKYINDAIATGKNVVPAYEMQSLMHVKKSEIGQAVTALNKAVAATNDAGKIQSLYSKMLKLQINNQDYEGALKSIAKLAGDQKASNSLIYYKAIAEYKVQQYTNCISTIESLVAKLGSGGQKAGSDASNAKYYFLMGLAAKKANQNQKAIDSFKKAEFGSFKAAAQAELQALSGK